MKRALPAMSGKVDTLARLVFVPYDTPTLVLVYLGAGLPRLAGRRHHVTPRIASYAASQILLAHMFKQPTSGRQPLP